MKIARFYVLCILVLGSLFLFAGNQVLAQQYEIGFGLGGGTYSGDIIRRIDPAQVGIQGTLFGRRNFDNAWSLRAGLSIARLNAADSVRPIDPMAAVRQAHFNGTVLEGAAVVEFHFLDYLSHRAQTRYTPYGFMGLGYTLFAANGQSFLGDPEAGNYTVGSPIIPFGMGIKYKLKERLILSLECGIRATLTDDLDKISEGGIQNPRFLEEPNTGNPIPNPQAFNFGNRNDKDGYYFLGVSLSYSFHKVKCYAY